VSTTLPLPTAPGATAQLAAWASRLRYEDIPADVLDKIRLSIVDTLGVILAASTTEGANGIVEAATRFDSRRGATVLGSGCEASPAAAALVNGTLSDILEWQDGWRLGGIHPCLVIPAALAVAEWRGASGRDLLTAIVAGYEVANRVAWSVHPQHMAKGYMPNGTAGSCGAAAAVGRLLGLSNAAMADALGIAGFLLPVSTAENLWGGYSIKPFHTGQAARTGVEAALLAAGGFRGCPLEGTPERGRGFLEITTGVAPDTGCFTEGLGERWTVRELYFKAYPICRQAHAAAEACLAIAMERRLRPEEIRRVRVSSYRLVTDVLYRQVDETSTMTAAQFSLPYIAAAALSDGAFGLEQLQERRRHDPALLSLSRRVELVEEPAFTNLYPSRTCALVEVFLEDGGHLSHEVSIPKGDPLNPVTAEETIAKFHALASPVIGIERAAALHDVVAGLHDVLRVDRAISPLRAGVVLDAEL
jgi:2-methylcitrate dehydratase PrpD